MTVFNSYYDKDEGPVAGLQHPPTVTHSMLIGAWLLKLLGFTIALFLGKMFLGLYIVGVVLSILYSHKSFRLKSNGFVAVLLNFIVGSMTFLAASIFSSPGSAILLLGSATAGLFTAAMCLMMQVHQESEDKRRQDTSIALLYGRRMALFSAIILIIIAGVFALTVLALSGLHWIYTATVALYVVFVLFASYAWIKKQGNPASDFKIMNTLTMHLSYAGNLILVVTYILNIVTI